MATAPVSAPAARARRPADGFRTVTTVVSLVAPLVLIAVVLVVGTNAVPAIRHFGAGFLTSRSWNPVKDSFGALPFIYGTLVTGFLGLALALPIGVGVAVFLAEQGAARIRGAIGIGVELLAAIPSVVYGIWGLYVLAPWLLVHVSRPLEDRLGSVIANEFTEATGSLYPAALIELGLVLMLVTLVVNVLALLLVRRVGKDVRL